MTVKKCDLKTAEHYINDLFLTLEIRGDNQHLFNQLIKLLMRYSKEIIKESWKEIVYSCPLPNGQMAGQIPKLEIFEQILQQKNIEQVQKQHKLDKQPPLKQGQIKKLWQIGVDYKDGVITKAELEQRVEALK